MLDKTDIKTILLNAQSKKQEEKVNEEKQYEEGCKYFYNLICKSINLNTQIRTQWIKKVAIDSIEPIHNDFIFEVLAEEFGLNSGNVKYFIQALSQYLFSLGFAYHSKDHRFNIFRKSQQPSAPIVYIQWPKKQSFFKRLFKKPIIYIFESTTVYGK